MSTLGRTITINCTAYGVAQTTQTTGITTEQHFVGSSSGVLRHMIDAHLQESQSFKPTSQSFKPTISHAHAYPCEQRTLGRSRRPLPHRSTQCTTKAVVGAAVAAAEDLAVAAKVLLLSLLLYYKYDTVGCRWCRGTEGGLGRSNKPGERSCCS